MGNEWFGTLPSDWQAKQLRYIFKIHNGSTPKSSEPDYWDGDIIWITPEDLGNTRHKIIGESRRKISREGFDNCGVSLAREESIALSTRAPIGHIAKTQYPSCVNQGCRLLEPKEGNSDYWYYACAAATPILISRGQGTTFMELPRQSLASIKIPVPPEPVQTSIARFLDYKTGQIDALIAKKEVLLAKLAEKRTALISHAVTKGLDPSVPMKDSKVEWLGEIPKHWDVCLLKRVADISYGVGGEIDRALTEGTKLLSLPNVTKDGMLLAHEFPYCEITEEEKKTALLTKGDLLFNWRNGSSDHLGKTAYFNLDGEWTHVSFLLKIRFDLTKSDPRYFQYMLTGLRITGFFTSSKAGVNNTFNMFELSNTTPTHVLS